MANLGAAAGWGLVVAASLTAGALAAVLLRLPERVAATATAFGGGILLAAVALELVPEADAGAGPALTAAGLLAGTLVYAGADAWLSRDPSMRAMRRMGHAAAAGRPMSDMDEPASGRPTAEMDAAAAGRPMSEMDERASGRPTPEMDDPARDESSGAATDKSRAGSAERRPAAAPRAGGAARDHAEAARGESIAAGIFVDGVPESVALGLTIAQGELGVALLAGVLLGNLVESYGAAQPILAGGHTRRFALGLLGGIGLALAAATIAGGTVLADASDALVGTAQAIAAGAVLAVISIAIVPHAFNAVSRTVAAATVAGFITGYLLS
jgi:ZIP family zinc transporter